MAQVNDNIASKVDSLNDKLGEIGVNPISYSSQTDLVSETSSKSQELAQLCENEYLEFIDVSTIMDNVQNYINEETEKITQKVNDKFSELMQNLTTKANEAAANSTLPTSAITTIPKLAADVGEIVATVTQEIEKVKEQITDRIERLTINGNIVASKAMCTAIEKAQKAKKKIQTKNKLNKLRNKE